MLDAGLLGATFLFIAFWLLVVLVILQKDYRFKTNTFSLSFLQGRAENRLKEAPEALWHSTCTAALTIPELTPLR